MSEGNPPDQQGVRPGDPTRPTSVQLRPEQEAVDNAKLMDPANESLADALRITFRILQIAMAVLAGLYILSGFQSIKTNERGIRLVFGKITAQDLPPGFQFAPPYPIGELVKVDVGNKDLNINRAFWPYVEPGRENDPVENLRARASLSPSQDGSLLTGDGSIAHTQWKGQYSRADATAFAQNVYTPHEEALVRAVVQRGIVHAVAEVTIDDLLKQSASDEGSVARRARAIAQDMFNDLGEESTGIELEQLSLEKKIPPAYLRDAFNSVLSATSQASEARENAQKEGNTLLSNTAGGAADTLIRLIDRYERQIDSGEAEAAEATLALIDGVFAGEPIEFDGEILNPSVGGRVATLLNQAKQYRSSVVDFARRDVAVFEAKLQQFRSNPTVMVTSDWTGAISEFFGDPGVQVFFQPPGTDTYELVINKDPELAKELERQWRLQQNEKAAEQREREMEADRFTSPEGLGVRG